MQDLERKARDFTARNRDQVERTHVNRRIHVVSVPKGFPKPAFCPVPEYGAPKPAGCDHAEPVSAKRVGRPEQHEVSRRHTSTARLNRGELVSRSQTDAAAERQGHGDRSGVHCRHASGNCVGQRPLRRDGQPLPSLCASALQDDPAVLGVHPNEKAMGLRPMTAVGLERSLHWPPGRVMTPWRNLNRSEPWKRVSMFSAGRSSPLSGGGRLW